MNTLKNYDAEFCGSLPLHLINLIQPHGILMILGFDDLKIIQISENIKEFLDIDPHNILNKSLHDFIHEDDFQNVKVKLEKWSTIMALESVKDHNDEIVDFKWLLANNTTERILQKSSSELVGKLTSKVQKDQQIRIEKLAFKYILEDVKVDLNGMIESTNTTLITDSKVDHLYFARINLRSILYNILSNAIKYQSHDRDPEIKISTSEKGKYIVLTIQDNGLGLNENQQKRLFTMFKRFKTHVDGTGIGLYIVKSIVENKEGKIEVGSKKGEGTTFNIYFVNEQKKYKQDMIVQKFNNLI
ncbi:hypothetical protein BH23BAC1_BH23BAC1_05070 [soil metagenome]